MTETPRETYCRNATVLYWHDADTVLVFLDLGYHTWKKAWIRLDGYDAPEENKPGHDQALARAEELCPPSTTIVVQTLRPLKKTFDRWVGLIWPNGHDRHVSQILTTEHLTKADFE